MFAFRALLILLFLCPIANAEILQTDDLQVIKRPIFASRNVASASVLEAPKQEVMEREVKPKENKVNTLAIS